MIFVPFRDGKPAGKPQDMLTGFLSDNGEAQSRPVGVRIDKQGALLVADDVGNTIWRVTATTKSITDRRFCRAVDLAPREPQGSEESRNRSHDATDELG